MRERVDQRPILDPVNSEMLVSVNDAVTRALREAILSGKIRPGDRLLQDELARQLGVSRQPVREALRRLQSEGLVVQTPQRGLLVREFTKADLQENYYLRQLLESEAAQSAAERITSAELQELKALNQAMIQAVASDDTSTLVELNVQFHRRIRESARMPALFRLLEQLWVGWTVFTPLFLPQRSRRSVREHAAIIAALEARDPERAAQTMREHIAHAAKEYFSQADSDRHSRGR